MVSDFKRAYIEGLDCFKNSDYLSARHWFEISCRDSVFREDSLSYLIQIDLIEGKCADARNLLNKKEDNQSVQIKRLYGLLENTENNFESSKKYHSECMIDPKMQNKSLLSIARLYIQTGDYEVARKMLETLQLNRRFYINATFELVYLNILEKNYKDAYKYLKSINLQKLYSRLLLNYQMLEVYLLRNLGELKQSDNNFDPTKEYVMYRLFDNSEELLIKHIEKHMNQKERKTNGCFFKYIDLKKILLEAREKIEKMNSNHFKNADVYRFRLDTPIGFKGEEITSDLCVVTILGTKDIITMYPVSLSDEFDREGYSTSEELMLKRNNGGIKI